MKNNANASSGTADVAQEDIEENALELARQAGHDSIEASDIALAQSQILGVSSPETAHLPTTEDREET